MSSLIKSGDWIEIGENTFPKNAVVCKVLEDNKKLEVVYLDNMDKPISENVVNEDEVWVFENKNPCGSYAERSDRLRKYITILKKGRY